MTLCRMSPKMSFQTISRTRKLVPMMCLGIFYMGKSYKRY